MTQLNSKYISLIFFGIFSGFACQEQPPEPDSRQERQVKDESASKKLALTPEKNAENSPSTASKSLLSSQAKSPGGDPLHGNFSLASALAGLPTSGQLVAQIKTDSGQMTCQLFENKAPITVANFVGLARGLRPFKDKGTWQRRPAYNGTTFHRVVKGFMIQGGDPSGSGMGQPGYVIKDEIWPGSRHDRRGQLCMANRGRDTNGQQFFITDGAAKHLDGKYTIFGQCSPESVIEKIAQGDVRGDRALKPVQIKSITIERQGS